MRISKVFLVLGVVLAILLLSVTVLAASIDLIILHTNDIHGRIEVTEGILGMPYISSLVSEYRKEYEHVLVLDAGDTLHGRPIADRLEGRSVVETMNVAGYDVMVPGNHDFNFGYDRLLELEELMEFDLVAANVFKDGELLFRPYVVKAVGEFTVGIIGLATSDTYTTTHPHNIIGIEFGDMVEATQKYVDILRSDYSVDLVIVLGHVGLSASRRISTEVSGIDLVVSGHSHSRLPEGEWNNDTLIVEAHEYTNYLGKVEIILSGDRPSMKASLISRADAAHLEPDAEIQEMLDAFRDEVRRLILGF